MQIDASINDDRYARRAVDPPREDIDIASSMSASARPWSTAWVLGLAFLALLLSAAGGAAYLLGRRTDADEMQRAERGLETVVAGDAAAVNDQLADRLEWLAAIAAHRQWRGALIDTSARAAVGASIRAVWPHAPPVSWIDERGRVVVGGGTLLDGDEVSGRRWFDAASRGALLSDEGGTLRAVMPLHDERRRTEGVLSVDLDCVALSRRLRMAAATQATWALVGAQGEVLCRHSGFDDALVQVLPAVGSRWATSREQERLLVAVQRLDGDARVRATGWRMVAAQPLHDALPRLRERLPRALTAGGLIALLSLPLVSTARERISPTTLTASRFKARARRAPWGRRCERCSGR
jgi:hypothetical protein